MAGNHGVSIEIDRAALNEAIRTAFSAVDIDKQDAGTRLWHCFLAHASRPLNWGDHFDRDPENDLLYLEAVSDDETLDVTIQRAIGVVRDGNYEGTLLSEVRVTAAISSSVARVGLEHYCERLDDFRQAFEATDAFAVMTRSRITQLDPLAYYR